MNIKATIVAYVFSEQYFKIATLLAYVSLRVNDAQLYIYAGLEEALHKWSGQTLFN